MNIEWPLTAVREILTERQETPDPDAMLTGTIRIVAKIGFAHGNIELRQSKSTRTKMILIHPGDIVVSGINAGKGAIGYYSDSPADPIAATIHYGAYIPHTDVIDPRYLWYYLRSDEFRSLLKQSLPQGIKTELKSSRLLSLHIPLPNLSKQRKIVLALDLIERQLKEIYHSQNRRLEQANCLMESILREWMNASWKLSRLQDVILFPPRSGPSFETHRDWKGTRVLMPSAVTGFGINPSKYECGIGSEDISVKDRLQPGDIVIARGNKRDQVGNAGIVPLEAAGWVCANLLMRMQIDPNKVDRSFLIYWLRSPFMREYVLQNISGTSPSIQKINQRVILNYPFPTLLSIKKQSEIAGRLDVLQRKTNQLIELCIQANLAATALKAAVLDKAFRGEL